MPANNRPVLRPGRTISLLLALACAFGTRTDLLAQEKDLTKEKRSQIEKAVSAFMTVNSVPGVSIAVVQNGRPLSHRGPQSGQRRDLHGPRCLPRSEASGENRVSWAVYRQGSVAACVRRDLEALLAPYK